MLHRVEKLSDYNVLVLGDTHGRENWKSIVQSTTWDYCIFLGDYFDPYDHKLDISMYENFREILEFKKDHMESVILLLGNHDYHYIVHDQHYSRYSIETANRVGKLLQECVSCGIVQIAFQIDDVVFTHAGITAQWYWTNILGECPEVLRKDIGAFYQTLGEEELSKVSEKLNRISLIKLRFTDAWWDTYGESSDNSPIWIRSNTLQTAGLKGIRQVVGHTQLPSIVYTGDRKVWFVDTLGTSGEYLMIEKGEFNVKGNTDETY